MTFEELKAIVVEWYEADVGDAKADKYLRRIDAQQRLELAARCLIEEGGESGGGVMTHTPEKWYVWDDKVTGEDKVEIIAENIRDEKTAHQIKAIPDMLRALEEVMDELDVEGLPCPLCGGSAASGHKYNCLWHVVNAAIRKARGEE